MVTHIYLKIDLFIRIQLPSPTERAAAQKALRRKPEGLGAFGIT